MITPQAIRDDIDRWFANPASVVPDCDTFQGVLVFERTTTVTRGPMRLGVVAGESDKRWWDREGNRIWMPFTSQPSAAWSKARCVGFATTKAEALALLFP